MFDRLAEPVVTTLADQDAEDIDAVDALDDELFPIFEEEADELLPQLQSRLREWLDQPGARTPRRLACARCTPSRAARAWPARCAWAKWRTGSRPRSKRLAARDVVAAADVEPLLGRADAMASAFDALRIPAAAAATPKPLAGADRRA